MKNHPLFDASRPAFFCTAVGAVTGAARGLADIRLAGTLEAGLSRSAFLDFRDCLLSALLVGAGIGLFVFLLSLAGRVAGEGMGRFVAFDRLIDFFAAAPGSLKAYLFVQTGGLTAACAFLLLTRNKIATLAFIPAVLLVCVVMALYRCLARRSADPRALPFRSLLAVSLWLPFFIGLLFLVPGLHVRPSVDGTTLISLGATAITILLVLLHQRASVGKGRLLFSVASPALTGLSVLFLLISPLVEPAGFEAKNPKNVILIGIDTLRRDFSNLPGNVSEEHPDLTPNLERLAGRGTVFNGAVTQTPWTIPSFASVFTGLYPHEHGAMTVRSRLGGGQVTLAEIFREAGYRTGSVVSHAFVSARRGFAQGFGFVNEENIRGVRAITADGVTDQALHFLDRQEEDPFFLFVHYFDCHATYMDHADSDLSDAYEGWLRNESREMSIIRYLRHLLGPDDLAFLRQLYGEEVRFVDTQLGRLVAFLEEKGLAEETAIVVLSDHGEEFMERGYLGHTMSLYDELIRVPLVFALPDGQGGGKIVDAAVETRAVFSTLLDYAGIGWRTEGMPRSLLPLITGERLPDAEGSDPLEAIAVAGCRPRPGGEGNELTSAALRSGQWKLIFDKRRNLTFLYDIDTDPGESTELSESRPEVLKKLSARINRWIDDVESHAGSGAGSAVEMSAQDERNLHNLGYM